MGFPLSSAYTSSKFALEGFTETLRAELKPYNIHTTLIQPGVVKTNFFENMKRHAPNLENSAYRDLTQGMIDITEKILTNAKIDGSHVAQEIKNILDTKPDYMRKPVGKDAEIALKKRNQLDDKDFENWLQGEFMEILKRGGS